MTPNQSHQSTPDCDELLDLIPDYAFGLTTLEQSQFVASNLAECPDADALLADYRSIQDEMRLSIPEMELPAMLGDRLMAAVATAEAEKKEPIPVPAVTSANELTPSTSTGWKVIRRTWLAWVAAAAVIALVITNVYWYTRVDALSRQQDQLASALQARDNNALVVANTDILRWVRLPPRASENSNAVLMWNAESKIGLLYVRGFPELEPGTLYQLWLTRGESRVSAGTFTVDEEGDASLLFHIEEPIDNYTWARVTADPDTGSQSPSDMVVVAGEL